MVRFGSGVNALVATTMAREAGAFLLLIAGELTLNGALLRPKLR